MGLFSSNRETQHRPANTSSSHRARPDARYLDEEPDEMPDEQPKNGHSRGAKQDNGSHRPRLAASKAINKAREYLESLTGRLPESVSGLAPGKEGWKVTLDVVELERIPPTTDVLASYELELDDEGELIGYHRLGRFYRNQVDER